MDIILNTCRLSLRQLTFADTHDLFELHTDPEVMKYMTMASYQSMQEAERQLQRYINEYDSIGFGRWAVIRKSDEVFIGLCGIRSLPGHSAPDLGYRLKSQHWGVGYATEAAGAVLHFALHVLGHVRVVAKVLKGNIASIRVLEKIGMQYVRTDRAGEAETLIFEAQTGARS